MTEQGHKPGLTGLARVVAACGYSAKGLRAAYLHEAAFRQELLLTAVLLPVAYLLAESGIEFALMAGALLLVLLVEILNSAIEAVVDRFGSELHPLSGRAKDLGSAAVMVALLLSTLIWGAILLPRWMN